MLNSIKRWNDSILDSDSLGEEVLWSILCPKDRGNVNGWKTPAFSWPAPMCPSGTVSFPANEDIGQVLSLRDELRC